MAIIGIDLGTTYSVVAIPGARQGEQFVVVGDVSIICDEHRRRIVPSVVAEDRGGNILVGYRAKSRAGLEPEPVMFSKRYMGTDQTFLLQGQERRAEEIAVHILTYLKDLASRQLGEPVTDAVITVPAWFSLLAKDRTEWAGVQADLRVAAIAPEPVAAAFAYFREDDRDPLRILTYDLGGGTFDVAVVEKRDGTTQILACDGDRFLGGHEFDRLLTFWLADQLCAQGYDLKLDLDDPGDRVRFAKLMVLAERAKCALSSDPVYSFAESATGLVDHKDADVTVDLEVSRATFEDFIHDDIESTMQLAHRALDKAQLTKDDIDEIVMVGGSSRIPYVRQRLAQEFGREPRMLDPDLCVAIGAALIAAAEGPAFDRVRLDRLPEETDDETLQVTGRVLPTAADAGVEGWRLSLARRDGGFRAEAPSSATGGFGFPEVPLARGANNDFQLGVRDRAGADRLGYQFSVRQVAQAGPAGLVVGPGPAMDANALVKELSILTVNGPYTVAKSRDRLPFRTQLQAETTDTSGEVRVPLMEGQTQLGLCHITNIPPQVPVGSQVDLTLEISAKFEVMVTAYLPAIAGEQKLQVQLAPPVRKTVTELRAEFKNLDATALDALSTALPGELFEQGRGDRLDTLLGLIRQEFGGSNPEPARVQELMAEAATLVTQLTSHWQPDPPRLVYEHRVQAVTTLIDEVHDAKPETKDQGYSEKLQALQARAMKALADQSDVDWRATCEELADLQSQLKSILQPRPAATPVDPAILLVTLARELEDLRRKAQDQGRLPELQDAFEDCARRLRAINAADPEARNQISVFYFDCFQPLEQKVRGKAGGGGLITIVGAPPAPSRTPLPPDQPRPNC
jgi:actin-like ATPase involved in cell morphogenesis